MSWRSIFGSRWVAPLTSWSSLDLMEGRYGRGAWRHRVWRPAIADAALAPLRPHDLRHTAVSLWAAAGASPNEVAMRAGHTSVSVVLDRYRHLFPAELEQTTAAGGHVCAGGRDADGRSRRTAAVDRGCQLGDQTPPAR